MCIRDSLKGMPRLEYLDLSGLALTELDISQNLELTYLVAGKSFMGVITQLTLPSPSKLQTVLLPYIGLTTLDLSGSPLLETLMVKMCIRDRVMMVGMVMTTEQP